MMEMEIQSTGAGVANFQEKDWRNVTEELFF